MDFNVVVTFLNQYIDKRALTPSVKVASVAESRVIKRQKTSTNCGNFKRKIEFRKYSREEYDSSQQHINNINMSSIRRLNS